MFGGGAARWHAALGRSFGRLSSGDRLALAVLIVLPVALVLPYSLAGHPLIPGDDLTQNYPLRVLAGADLASGHLPSWDPFIWSGTPLLAGWNAGALYPGTWLFAVLPGIAAWTANLIAVPVVAGTGMYVLLRGLHCRPLAAAIGALVFSDTGFMSGQVVHIGLVQGSGFLPWTLVAVDVLAVATRFASRAAAVVLLGGALGLCVLAGEPRAVSSEAVVLAIYVAALVLRAGRGRRVGIVAGSVAGAALGAGLSAVQWVPGLSFVSSSQRGLGAYAAFGAGSLDLKTLVHFLLVPFLVGGNGNFGLPLYRAGYNLPEETIGVGLLPLCAALAYLPDVLFRPAAVLRERFTRAAARHRDGSRGRRDVGVWYAIGLVGVLLTMGETTPLGRVLVHIPLYGGERLQNRNAVLFDLALAVLGAYLVEDLTVGTRRCGTGRTGVFADPVASRARQLLMLVPPGATVALVAAAYLHPLGVEHAFGVAAPLENLYDRLTPYLAVTVGLAVAVGLFWWAAPRLLPHVRSLVLAPLAVVDVGLYVANASYATAPSAVLAGTTPVSGRLAALTSGGRFAIFNPLVSLLPDWPRYVDSLGETDLNILRGLPSVQGYGSIVGGGYEDATNTHDFEDLDTSALDSGLFDSLDLRALLSLPEYLEEVIPAHSAIPVAGAPPVTEEGRVVAARDAPAPPLLSTGPWTVPAAGEQQWRLAADPTVVRLAVVLNATDGRVPASIEVGLAAPGGAVHLLQVRVANAQAHVDLAVATKASAVVVRNPSGSPVTVGAVVAVTEDPDLRLVLDGALQGQLAPAHWADAGVLGPFSVFVTRGPLAAAWLEPVGSSTADNIGGVPGLVTTPGLDSSRPIVVDADQPSLLVRSETYQSGWTATITPIGGGRARTLAVERLGLIQAVPVPKGRDEVSFSYGPPSLPVGALVAAASVAGLLGILGAVLVTRRRERRAAQVAAGTGHGSHP